MALEVSELGRHVSGLPGRSSGPSTSGGGASGEAKQRKSSNNIHHRWLGWLRSSRCSRGAEGTTSFGEKFGKYSESVPSSTERKEMDRLSISVSNDPWKPVFTTKVPINSGEEFLSLAMDSRRVYSGNECTPDSTLSSSSFRPSLVPLKTLAAAQAGSFGEIEEDERRNESSEEGSVCFSDVVAETVALVANSEGDDEEEALTSASSSKSTPIRKAAPSIKSPFLERATNKFSSPFRRFRGGDQSSSNSGHSSSSSNSSTASNNCHSSTASNNCHSSTDNSSKSKTRNMSNDLALFEDRKSLRFTREELLRLYVMKLDEEANYFKTNSPEDEFCTCPKCQSYYCEYYSQYLDEFEARRNLIGPIEASVLMDDMLNNGMTFCSIM